MIGIGPNIAYQPAVSRHSSGASLEFDFTTGSAHPIEGNAALVVTRAGDTATRFNPSGVLEVCAANTARLQHDPSVLEFENKFVSSEDFADPLWVKSGVSVSSNAALSSKGELTADKLVESVANSDHNSRQAATVSSGEVHTFSVFLKAAERTQAALEIYTGASVYKAVFNLSAGTFISSSGSGSYQVTPSVNGWYRIAITATTTSTSLNAFVHTASGGVTSYLGDGASGVYVDRAQLNTGPTALAYKRTGATTYPKQYACDGLLAEDAATNSIRNNTATGAVAGTPGTAPTHWGVSSTGSGVTREVVDTGAEDGIEYVAIRFYGTPVGITNVSVSLEGVNSVAASAGQTWATSLYLRHTAGTLDNATVTISVLETDGVSTTAGWSSAALTPTSARLVTQRVSLVTTLIAGGTTNIQPRLRIGLTDGMPIDLTLRIGLPKLERDKVTSVIKTSGAEVTRNADSPDVAIGPWYNQTEGRILVEYSQSFQAPAARALSLDNGSSANSMQFVQGFGSPDDHRFDVTVGSVVQAQLIYTLTGLVNTTYKAIAAYKSNDIAGSENGAAVLTDTAATIPAVTIMRIGYAPGSARINGPIKRVAYWRSHGINADLPQMSA